MNSNQKSMLKLTPAILGFGLLGLFGLLGYANAQEQGRVLSSTPVVKQFYVPQQVCGTSQVAVPEPKTGAGAVVGAVAGGLIGSTLGSGAGQAASTAIGAISGAIVGNNLETPSMDLQKVSTCSTQNVLQNATVYQVVYEYAGKQYNIEMQSDPGKFVNIQLNPVAQGQLQPSGTAPPPGSAPVVNYASGAPTLASTIVTPAPAYTVTTYSYPSAYPYGYGYGYGYVYPPVAIGFGYYGGCCGRRR